MISAMRARSSLVSRTRSAPTLSSMCAGRREPFVGPTVCYAFMQAVGLVNDHVTTCFRYRELARAR
jgi:DNA-3-methyladenine glycosylase I